MQSQEHPTIGFIGAGKAGFTLGRYFCARNLTVSGYASRNPESAKAAAQFTNSRFYADYAELTAHSDWIFLTVPDGAIASVWQCLKTLPLKKKTICHVSGSLASSVLEEAEQLGAAAFSVHPLFAISDRYHSWESVGKCIFTVEGKEGAARQQLVSLLERCGNAVEVIPASEKALYHAAAVVTSNFVVGLSYLGSQMLQVCGFSEENAQKALVPLLEGNVKNIIRQGSVQALTGPVERADVQTVQRHLQTFAEHAQQFEDGEKQITDWKNVTRLYCDLTQILTEVGQKKHKEHNYEPLKEVLKREEHDCNISENER